MIRCKTLYFFFLSGLDVRLKSPKENIFSEAANFSIVREYLKRY